MNTTRFADILLALLGFLAVFDVLRFAALPVTLFDVVLVATAALMVGSGSALAIPRPLFIVSCAVLGVAAASTLRAIYPTAALGQIALAAFLMLAVVPVVFSLVRARGSWPTLLGLTAGIVVSLAGSLYVYATTRRVDEFGNYDPKVEFHGLGNIDRVAYFGAPLLLFWLIAGASRLPDWWRGLARGLAMLLFVVSGFLIAVSFSRSGIIAYVTGLAIFAAGTVVGFVDRKTLKRALPHAITTALLLLVLLLMTVRAVVPAQLAAQFEQGVTLQGSVAWRLGAYVALAQSLPDTLVLGWGMHSRNTLPRIESLSDADRAIIPHNIFLEWWAMTGVVGMLLFATVLLYVFVPGWRAVRAPDVPVYVRWAILALAAGFAAYLVDHLAHASWVRRFEWFVYAAMLGLAVRALERRT
jgi:O-antigen ligase